MKERLKSKSFAQEEERGASGQEGIERAGFMSIDGFERDNKAAFSAIDPEAFDGRMDMARQEVHRIGGVLGKFQGKAAYMIGMTMLGLSLSWGMPHGAGAAQPQTAEVAQKTPEVVKEAHYKKVEQVLQEMGIKISPDTYTPRNMIYRTALIEADNRLMQEISILGARLRVQGEKAQRNNVPVGADFEKDAYIMAEKLALAEKLGQVAEPFFPGQDFHRHKKFYGQEQENVRTAFAIVKGSKNPSEEQKKIYELQKELDRLEEKEKKEKLGLEYRDMQLMRELRGKLKQLKEKSPQGAPSGLRQGENAPQQPEQKPAHETPADTMERTGKELRGSAERLQHLNQQLNRELERILQPQGKK